MSFSALLGENLIANVEQPPREPWNCPQCTYANTGNDDECAMCGTPASNGGADSGPWSCPTCTLMNDTRSIECEACGSPRERGEGDVSQEVKVDTKQLEGKYIGLYFRSE
jgi:hypothetical protein